MAKLCFSKGDEEPYHTFYDISKRILTNLEKYNFAGTHFFKKKLKLVVN